MSYCQYGFFLETFRGPFCRCPSKQLRGLGVVLGPLIFGNARLDLGTNDETPPALVSLALSWMSRSYSPLIWASNSESSYTHFDTIPKPPTKRVPILQIPLKKVGPYLGPYKILGIRSAEEVLKGGELISLLKSVTDVSPSSVDLVVRTLCCLDSPTVPFLSFLSLDSLVVGEQSLRSFLRSKVPNLMTRSD